LFDAARQLELSTLRTLHVSTTIRETVKSYQQAVQILSERVTSTVHRIPPAYQADRIVTDLFRDMFAAEDWAKPTLDISLAEPLLSIALLLSQAAVNVPEKKGHSQPSDVA
jgi:hypothetical protein